MLQYEILNLPPPPKKQKKKHTHTHKVKHTHIYCIDCYYGNFSITSISLRVSELHTCTASVGLAHTHINEYSAGSTVCQDCIHIN